MRETIRFILGDTTEEVRITDPTRTVLDFLRDDKGLTGTKEGCNEGDCGACTVVIAEPHGDGLRYRAVNSCIQFLPTLDGKQLITVEDLQAANGGLHPVQQAMVDLHGSQCGFCTPGFVMSLFAMFHELSDSPPDRVAINRGLAGNLCRCTGYAPIVRAAQSSLSGAREDHFTRNEAAMRDRLREIQAEAAVGLADGGYFAPRSLEALCELLEQYPAAVLLAGGTDVGLWVTKQLRELETVIYLGSVPELRTLEERDGYLHIGAGVTYTDAETALNARYPEFGPLVERLGALQVRNAGTIGGNIANGSPIGDMPPGLIAAGSKLVLRSSSGRRVLDLEDFFLAYGKQDLRPGECVEKLMLPVPEPEMRFGTYKVSKRSEQDISAVCGAYGIWLDNGRITRARVCYGGMAETPRRAAACERSLLNQPWDRATIENAMTALSADFTPITDVRAGAGYRMRVAQNLLLRFYLENSTAPYPVRLGGHGGGARPDA
jgi:xanthine dehydrogenase small subunit